MILQNLGYEIRKIGTIADMYKEVDRALNGMPKNFLAQTIAHGLQKMFETGGHLSVCFIKEASEAAGIIIPKDKMQTYHMLHCMSWRDMEPNYRAQIMASILDDFRPVLMPEETKEVV